MNIIDKDTRDRVPIRISKIAGRYLLFDIDDVMYIRRYHNMCPVFSGTTPQNPQQNQFSGLPVELMAEEAAVLVNRGLAFVADDAVAHALRLAGITTIPPSASQSRNDVVPRDARLNKYLKDIQDVGRGAQMAAQELQQESFERHKLKAQQGREKKNKNKRNKGKAEATIPKPGEVTEGVLNPGAHSLGGDGEHAGNDDDEEDASLFNSATAKQATAQSAGEKNKKEYVPFATTPTTSGHLILPPTPLSSNDNSSGLGGSSMATPTSVPIDNLPSSYPLYAHLQSRGYYMMPGLRFGCSYNVYPGDPLRFHAHFQAVSYDWEDESIDMLDLGAGGRLGTRVKKGYLIGGAVTPSPTASADSTEVEDNEGDGAEKVCQKGAGNWEPPEVRTFSIEWAGM